MRIQSAGTGLVDGAFFSALGDAEAVEVDAAGLAGDVLAAGVLAAGLEPQPAAASASAHTKNTNFFINPPNKVFVLEIRPDYQAGKPIARVLDEIAGESPQLSF
jgi:hypothetical protein